MARNLKHQQSNDDAVWIERGLDRAEREADVALFKDRLVDIEHLMRSDIKHYYRIGGDSAHAAAVEGLRQLGVTST
jgi:hypothetical protein